MPDFPTTKPPTDKAKPGATGMDALPGTAAFVMKSDGLGWLYVPEGLVDGPLPTHYEPAESVVRNPLYKQQSSPVLKYWNVDGNRLAEVGDPKYPYIITTYRLTEHYLSGAMSRWEGLATGDVVNEMSALVADPNVSIHEGKVFVCNVEKA